MNVEIVHTPEHRAARDPICACNVYVILPEVDVTCRGIRDVRVRPARNVLWIQRIANIPNALDRDENEEKRGKRGSLNLRRGLSTSSEMLRVS